MCINRSVSIASWLLLFSITIACSHINKVGSSIKEWASGLSYVKFEGQGVSRNLNEAVSIANQEAIKKIRAVGCDPSDKSDTFYRKKGNDYIAIVKYHILEKECKPTEFESCTADWVKESARSQAGGWIWFPGRATNTSLSLATLYAEGAALNYLKGECRRIPVETMFHERCVEKVEHKYIVYVRASIRERNCSYGNEINAELTRRHLSYQASLAHNSINKIVCNQSNPIGCYQLADKEWRIKNLPMAIAYAESACTFGDMYSCGFLGFMHYQLQNPYEAKQYLEIGCKRDGAKVWCDLLADLEKQLKEI